MSTPVISIVDYGIGNIGSVANMLRRIGAKFALAANPEQVEEAEALILPGVGAFDAGMNALREKGLVEPLLRQARERRVPILGICLGMQLLGNGSEEGDAAGLQLIDADFVRFRFPAGSALKVPHMGWNTLEIVRQNPILDATEGEQRFYFVHSYFARVNDPSAVVATADYGGQFVAVFGRDNIYGVQFHPEKSHKFGMSVLRNFTRFRC